MTTTPIPDFHSNRPISQLKVVVTRNLGPDVMPLLLQRQDLEASSFFGNSNAFDLEERSIGRLMARGSRLRQEVATPERCGGYGADSDGRCR